MPSPCVSTPFKCLPLWSSPRLPYYRYHGPGLWLNGPRSKRMALITSGCGLQVPLTGVAQLDLQPVAVAGPSDSEGVPPARSRCPSVANALAASSRGALLAALSVSGALALPMEAGLDILGKQVRPPGTCRRFIALKHCLSSL